MPTTPLTLDPALRFEILDLVTRYATAIDTKDWDLFRSTFANEVVIDYGPAVGSWTDPDAFTTFMRDGHQPAGRTLHRMSNTTITGTDPLTARTYGDGIVLEADNTKGTLATAWYDDEITPTSTGLKISRRTVHMILFTPVGPNLAATM
ncbi:nuclear transport factor 2 family protein [Glaciihabitans sp. UYNi722]|uniref:nuclear transport factor 2 family protein n=1 Tax=Glaciihabitans sp. UYNi722 TaxID=3156344 RepID=UPI003392928A